MEKKGDKEEKKQDLWGSRPGIGYWRAQAWFHGPPEILTRKNSRNSHTERQVHGSRLHGKRSVASSMGSKWRRLTLKGELRAVSYLSAEFLMGPQLANNLINLGIYEEVREAVEAVRRRLECPSGARTGTWVGKWRAWSTRRLFFGFPCHSGDSLDRLRNTL